MKKIKKDMAEFYKKIFSNAKLKERITEKAKEIANEKDLRTLIREEIMPLVKKYKLNFSEEELIEYEENSFKKLAKEDLYNVSGGINFKPLLLNGGLLSFALLGVGIANAPIADAVITKAQIEKACESVENVRIEPFSAVYNKIYDLRHSYFLILSGALDPFRFENGLTTYLNFEKSDGGQIYRVKWNDIHGPGAVNLMVKLFPSTPGQVCTGGGRDGNHPFSKHCHPVPKLVAAVPAYLYNYVRTDNQEVAAEARRILEELIEKLESYTAFYKNRKEFERWKNETQFEIEGNELKITKQPSQRTRKLLQVYNNVVPNDQKIDGQINSQKLKEVYDACGEKYGSAALKELEKKRQVDINAANNFCRKYLEYDIISHAKNQRIDVYPCILTFLHVVYDSTISIEQEKQGLLDHFITECIWGCYFILQFNTLEDAIKYYDQLKKLIHINTSDYVKEYYDQLKNRIHNLPNLSEEEINQILSDINNKRKLFGKIYVVDECPYTQKLVSNESAYLIKFNKDGTVCFENDDFQDCVETTTLQLMNLLMYNNKDEWNFVLGDISDEKVKQLKAYYMQAIKFMPNSENFEIGSFNDRFAANFVYQIDNGVENMSKERRSLWNLALFNQTVKNGFVYDITYKRDNIKNEVKSGCLNMLKLIYNCVYKFKYAENTSETSYELKLTTAKEKIDELESAINRNNSHDAKDALKEALESTFALFCDEVTVEIDDDVSLANNDCYAKIEVSKTLNKDQDSEKSLEFTLDQMDGHAYIRFNPVKVEKVEKRETPLIKYIKSNTITKLFACKFGGYNDSDNYEDDENSLGIDIDIDNENSPFFWLASNINPFLAPEEVQEKQIFKNHAALLLLKRAQENPGDINTIIKYINPLCNKSNITISIEKDKGTLSDFILDNYAITSDSAFCNFYLLGDEYNLSLKSDDNEFYKYVKSKKLLTTVRDNEYYCKKVKPGSTEVVVFPFVAPGTKKVKIPATVVFEGKICPVVGTVNNFTIKNIKEVELEEGIKEFKFGDYSFFQNSTIRSIKLPKSLMSLKFGRYSFSGTSLNELDFSNLNHFANITFETSSFEEAVLKNGLNFSNLDNLTEVVFGDCSFKFYSGGIKCNNIKNLKTLSFGCSAFENSELDQVPFTIKQGETTCPNSCVYNDYIFIQSIHTVNIGKLAFWESFEDIPHPKKDSKFTPIRLYTGENISDKHIDDFTGIECIPFSYKSKEDLKDKLDFLYRLYEYGILGINCVDKLCRDIFIGDVKLLVENINNKNSELFDKGKPYMPEAQEKIKEFWDKIKI